MNQYCFNGTKIGISNLHKTVVHELKKYEAELGAGLPILG
jgi:hypothetical protein